MKYVAKQPDHDGHIHFTAEENAVWEILIKRQIEVIKNRASKEFIDGLQQLNLPLDRIPQCEELSAVLRAKTGWSVKPVAAIIPINDFFQLLANRQFPAATFIRVREELDYLQEPDIFHEYFGHCPLLTNQTFADFMQWYGEIALSVPKAVQTLLGRLFWFTVEFGLIQTPQGIRVYGGGILSSYQETIYALESETPQRLAFDLPKVLRTPYFYDRIQERYFVINNISELYHLKSAEIVELAKSIARDSSQDNSFVIC